MVVLILKSFVSSVVNLVEFKRIKSLRGRGLNLGDLIITLTKSFNKYKSSISWQTLFLYLLLALGL